ncbi:MAG: hypothetical protein FWC84_05635 [Alphaproteobacteria bacterium]|nr:hypothetical protein [Alphaproteobacteria bacterium]
MRSSAILLRQLRFWPRAQARRSREHLFSICVRTAGAAFRPRPRHEVYLMILTGFGAALALASIIPAFLRGLRREAVYVHG